MTVDLRTTAGVFTSVMNNKLTTPTWEEDGDYFYSYPVDPENTYYWNPNGVSYPFSTYFQLVSAPMLFVYSLTSHFGFCCLG